jgi:REP element-mobilizing transposase RayT
MMSQRAPQRTRVQPVIAYHLVWTNYGTWLPNDPRGSTSQSVVDPFLAQLGPAHFGRKKKQPRPAEVREFYTVAEPLLKFPVIRWEPEQLIAVGKHVGTALRQCNYTCYACAVMPDHVHLILRRHRDDAEEMIAKLQAMTRDLLQVSEEFALPGQHPVWTLNGWKRFLSTPADIYPVIKYIWENPLKQNLPAQPWEFVTHYDNWPFQKKC